MQKGSTAFHILILAWEVSSAKGDLDRIYEAFGIGIEIGATIPILFIIIWPVLTFQFNKWLNYIVMKTGYFKRQKLSLNLCCIIIGFITIVASYLLRKNHVYLFDLLPMNPKTAFLLIVLFIFGFLISIVSESHVAARLMNEEDLKIVPVIFKMNIVSYFILIVFMVIRASY